MISFARTDTSIVGRWWWTVDRWTLLAVTLLIAIGTLLTLAASPAVARSPDISCSSPLPSFSAKLKAASPIRKALVIFGKDGARVSMPPCLAMPPAIQKIFS